jgi:hypothetical protein
MRKSMILFQFFLSAGVFIFGIVPSLFSQQQAPTVLPPANDPCGFTLGRTTETARWGYDFSALIVDLQNWALHPAMEIDVIGRSVQQRPLFHLVFTNPASQLPKKRIWLHARTHPIEAESSEVMRAVISELLSGSDLARSVLDHCVVHVLPMLNPDGVELRASRENANGVDLESNWGATFPEPEVAALRGHLTALMESGAPIEVALNLHSAYTCKRYFVYHAAEGTSILFTQLEQQFIAAVRDAFPGGIEPYDFFVTWTEGTPDRYPESWFWRNYGDKVMALTYEDMNCATAGDFDRTARALLKGTAAYLQLGSTVTVSRLPVAASPRIEALYPNPVPVGSAFSVALAGSTERDDVTVSLHDQLGRTVQILWEGELTGDSRTLRLSTEALPSGSYHILLRSRHGLERRLLMIGS